MAHSAQAREELASLKRALVDKDSSPSGLAVLTRSIAHHVGLHDYVRWMDCEIGGYKGDGSIEEVLRLDPKTGIQNRVVAYRRQTGTVVLSTHNGMREPLPYPLILPQPLSEIEAWLAESAHGSQFVLSVPVDSIPQDGIREQLVRWGVNKLPVTFRSNVPAMVLAGFRTAVAGAVSELDAAATAMAAVPLTLKNPSPGSQSPDFEYDVALSFAGEDRTYVQNVADLLKQSGTRVFYDEFEKSRLWGKNLYDRLSETYSKKARYCVMFISEHYAKKAWTNMERQASQARAFTDSREYILPVRFDDTQIPGIHGTVGYIDLRVTEPGELVLLIREKLAE